MDDNLNCDGIQELFSFEKSAVPLDDGNWFQALKEAAFRWIEIWHLSAYHDGTQVHALYQRHNASFVWMEFVANCAVARCEQSGRVCDCEDPYVARNIPAVEATHFLVRNHFEIPDGLLDNLKSLTNDETRAEPPQPRPLSQWEGRGLLSNERESAGEYRVIDLLQTIRDSAVFAVQELQSGFHEGDRRATLAILNLGARLFDQFPVDPKKWWGSKSTVPPKHVDLLKLQWPDGIPEIRNEVIPKLRQLLDGPVSVIRQSGSPISDPDRPTHEEKLAAEQQLNASLPEIDKLTVRLSRTLDALESGAIHQQLLDEAPKTRKPPTDNEIAAYLHRQLFNHTNSEINTKLKLGVVPGTISRMISKVRKWHGEGNPLPKSLDELGKFAGRTQTVDPSVLDMGAPIESRTPRQKSKKSD